MTQLGYCVFIINLTLLNIDFKFKRDPISATHTQCNAMNLQEMLDFKRMSSRL